MPIYSYNQTVTEQYGNMAILERNTHNYNITDRKVLILFNIPPIAENKKGEP